MKKACFLLILLFLLMLGSCGDDTPRPFSQVYFSCKIDGVVFNAEYKTDFGYRSIDAQINNAFNSVLISADDNQKNFGLLVRDTLEINKIYTLTTNSSGKSGMYSSNSLGTSSYITDTHNIGYIEFSEIDYQNGRIAGTFSFVARDSIINDTVHITDGKFRAYLR